MKSLVATTRATIYGYHNCWSLMQRKGVPLKGIDCNVQLEIQGDGGDKFILLISPDGFFAADTWHETVESAMETAKEILGVDPTEWLESN